MHAIIGGPAMIRGFRKERFWGKSAFYNNNELRFITNIRSHLLTAKFGLLGFFDDGRVWMPGETSDKWHTGYGGGILFAPFSRVCLVVTYGISDEMKLLQIRMNKLF
jgi:hemolysin activation/secretion protein